MRISGLRVVPAGWYQPFSRGWVVPGFVPRFTHTKIGKVLCEVSVAQANELAGTTLVPVRNKSHLFLTEKKFEGHCEDFVARGQG